LGYSFPDESSQKGAKRAKGESYPALLVFFRGK
jgi:hypothetical protein